MKESGYYAPGTEFDPSAPWNQVDPPDVDFNVEANVTLSRTAVVTTNSVYNDEWTYRICEDVGAKGAYEQNYASIPELLAELVKFIDSEMQGDISHDRRWKLQRLRDSATDWQVIDEDYGTF